MTVIQTVEATLTADVKGFTRGMAAASAAIGALGFVIAKSASDFEQTGSLIERVFEGGSPEVERFAETMSQELGTSLQETRQGLVSIGAQLKNTLGDTGAAQAQSQAIVQLAADISAAQNIPFADTLERIQAGLRGEAEGIEKLNIFIGEASLKQEALRKGIQKSTEKMNEQEKTSLRLSAIFRQTADLTGAAAAEASTFAGQTARLDAEVKNLAVAFGQALLPAATKIVAVLREAVGFFRELSPEMKQAVVAAGLAAAAFGAAAFVLVEVGAVLVKVTQLWTFMNTAAALSGVSLAGALGTAALAAGVFTIAYVGASTALDQFGLGVPRNVSVMTELKDAFISATSSVKGLLRQYINLVAAFAAGFATISTLGASNLLGFNDAVEGVRDSLVGMIDEAEETDRVVNQMLALEDAAAFAEEGLAATAESGEKLGGALQAAEVPLANTAEAIDFLKRKQDEAAKSAKEHAAELKKQADAFKALNDFAKSLQGTLSELEFPDAGIGAAVAQREGRIGEAQRLGADVTGVGAGLGLAGVADEIDRLFLRELGDSLAKVPFDKFVGSMTDAEELLEAMGFSIQDVTNASPELGARMDDLGTGFVELVPVVDDFKEAVSNAASELTKSVVGGIVETATGGAGLGGAGVSLGAAGGGVVDALTGGTGLGALIGGILGGVLGKALDALVAKLEVVTPLMDGLGLAIDALGPAMGSIRKIFVALGQVLVAAVPLIDVVARILVVLIDPIVVLVQLLALLASFILILAATIGQLTVGVVEWWKTFWGPVLESLVRGAQALVNGFINGANEMTNWIRTFTGMKDFGIIVDHVDLDLGEGFTLGVGDPSTAAVEDFGTALGEATEGVDELGDGTMAASDGMKELNEAILGATSDFKVAAYRFAAQDVSAGSVGDRGSQLGAAFGQGNQIIINGAVIQANNAYDLVSDIERIARRGNIRRRGTNIGRPDYLGRGEG